MQIDVPRYWAQHNILFFHHYLTIILRSILERLNWIFTFPLTFDAPLVRSTLGNIIVSEMSAENDIVFSGEGGDEIFAGYNYFLDIDSKKQVQDALVCALESLHNTALQRVDRSSNSCGVNCKLPMLDEDLVEYALMIPPDEKLDYDKCLTKIVLRKLAEKSLPYDIAWRPKDKFWEGSGIYNIIGKKIDKIITDSDYLRNRKINDNFILRNKEELYYYRIFRSFYPEVDYNNFLSFTKVFN